MKAALFLESVAVLHTDKQSDYDERSQENKEYTGFTSYTSLNKTHLSN
jgi:predicted glycosyltransferase involved in capsule biosynthesis